MTVNEKRFNYKWLTLPLAAFFVFIIGLLMDIPLYRLRVWLDYTFILFILVMALAINSFSRRLPIKGISTRQKEYLVVIFTGILILFIDPDFPPYWVIVISCVLLLLISLVDTLLSHIDFKLGSKDQPIFSWRTFKTKMSWIKIFIKPDGPVELIVSFSAYLLYLFITLYFVIRYITPTFLTYITIG
jgi:hypothetical protein